jgi:hypothetical protein
MPVIDLYFVYNNGLGQSHTSTTSTAINGRNTADERKRLTYEDGKLDTPLFSHTRTVQMAHSPILYLVGSSNKEHVRC